MTEDHHDPDLCKRLATKVMGWTKTSEHGRYWLEGGRPVVIAKNWDPCCNPAHSVMPRDKLVQQGWTFEMSYDTDDCVAFFWKSLSDNEGRSTNPEHATSLAAKAAVTRITQDGGSK
jgi:hypothetical protein